jgi:hypothetical protein
MAMSFLDELRTRYKAKQKDWEKYKEQVREAKEREAKAREEMSALQVLMASEQGKGTKAKEQPVPAAVPLPIAPAQNKAEIVRLLIQERGSSGLVPAQIRQLLEDRKVPMPTNYLYAVLLRAKKAGTISERNGKYYPADQDAKAAS